MRIRESEELKIVLWVYGIGLAGMLLPFTRQVFILLTPLNLLFAAVMLFHRSWRDSSLVSAGLIIIIAGFLVEAAGVKTGAIFGHYGYGKALGPRVLETPVIIGLNWLILVYCTNTMARQAWSKFIDTVRDERKGFAELILFILTGAFLMVVYDFILEPAAMKLSMWTWKDSHIPPRNFIAWFIVSAFFHSIYHLAGNRKVNELALPMYVIQVLFFGTINVFFYVIG